MVRKKCIEVASRYFKIVNLFIEREKEKIKEERGSLCRLLKIKEIKEKCVLLEKGEILKKRGECLDDLIYVHHGGLLVRSSSGGSDIERSSSGDSDIERSSSGDTTTGDDSSYVSGDDSSYVFGPGDVFGYFSLFFDVYKTVEIKASRKTKISLFDYNALKKSGLDEEDFEGDLLRNLFDFIHLIDVCCDWRILVPGTIILEEGEVPEEFFYMSEGQAGEYVTGMTVGCKECLLREKSPEISTTKISEVISIPRGLVEHSLRKNPSFSEVSRIFLQEPTPGVNIITVLPADKETKVLLFVKRLKASIGKACLLLSSKEILSKKVFTVSEELRVMDYLRRMGKAYPVVIVYMENEYSRFLRYLLKYSTTCLIIGEGSSMCSSRKDSTTSHTSSTSHTSYCTTSPHTSHTTPHTTPHTSHTTPHTSYCTFEYVRLYEKKEEMTSSRRVHHILSPSRTILFDTKDFERLGRFLLNKRVGLVLSGGGARGVAHIGVIQALEEEGIPIDIVGGTSMGAFVGALYARSCDNGYVFKETKKFCNKARSIWPYIFDLTYPICSFFKGKAIDKSLQDIFKDQKIQDLWLEYFCMTTNLFTNDEEVHQEGILWQFVRASMGICGYLPPVCDPRGFLVDGGYMNNVPADVMQEMSSLVLAVDIGTVLENDYDPYDDGFVAFFHRYFGTRKYLTMEEIQYRIAFLTTEKKIKEVENNPKVLMIRPNLGDIKTMDFHRFDEIVATGYHSAREIIREWKTTGVYDKYFKKKISRRRYSV